MYLCEDCAKELGVMDEFAFEPLSMAQFLRETFWVREFRHSIRLRESTDAQKLREHHSPTLSIRAEQAAQTAIQSLKISSSRALQSLHGTETKHIGKFVTYSEEAEPKKVMTVLRKKSEPKSEIEKLKEDLKLAVKEQRFEDAAVIRDKIQDLTQEG